MWRPFRQSLNPARYEFDPFLNMEKLRDAKDVYLSANLGIRPYGTTTLVTRSTPSGNGELLSSPFSFSLRRRPSILLT
ncbi:MAG: hypothetical protein U1U88_001266 [Lawsonella clevelandensis]